MFKETIPFDGDLKRDAFPDKAIFWNDDGTPTVTFIDSDVGNSAWVVNPGELSRVTFPNEYNMGVGRVTFEEFAAMSAARLASARLPA